MSIRRNPRRTTAAGHLRHVIVYVCVVALGVFLAPGVLSTIAFCSVTAVIAFFTGWQAATVRTHRPAARIRQSSRYTVGSDWTQASPPPRKFSILRDAETRPMNQYRD